MVVIYGYIVAITITDGTVMRKTSVKFHAAAGMVSGQFIGIKIESNDFLAEFLRQDNSKFGNLSLNLEEVKNYKKQLELQIRKAGNDSDLQYQNDEMGMALKILENIEKKSHFLGICHSEAGETAALYLDHDNSRPNALFVLDLEALTPLATEAPDLYGPGHERLKCLHLEMA